MSPRRNAYTALLRSCIGSCMIWVSRWFLRAYTSSPIWTMSSTKSLALAGPRDDAARTAANSRFKSPGTTPAIRDSVHLQPCSLHATNSTALSVRGSSAVNSSAHLHRSPATSSSRAHSRRMWPMSSSGPPQKIQGWAGIAIRVSFRLHRRMTCMVDKRPSRARSIFLCVGPWCTAPRGRDYGWELLAHGTHSPKVARWPRLLESLPVMPDGRPILRPVSTWEDARRSPLSCATARTLAGALLGLQDACCDVWQDLWSQCCDGSCVPSRSVLPQRCHGCRETASVWVHQCASVPLCGTCKERADRGWPKARWALRHSGQMSSSAWKTIQGGLKSVRVEGVRCPGAPSAALPLMLWWAALEGDSRILWLWHHGGNGDGVVGAGGDAD